MKTFSEYVNQRVGRNLITMGNIDIVKEGSKIFFKLFKEFDVTEITDIHQVGKFFDRLITEMKGLVIVDFMDAGNWDCLGSYHIDYENQFLTLNWHYYSNSTKIDSFIEQVGYKPSIMTVMLHFKELKIESYKNFPFVTLRGFALKNKDVLKYYKKIDPDAKHLKDDGANFYSLFYVDRQKYIEECYCHDTPIYSILITPKDTAGRTDHSMRILFMYNYENCKERILKIQTSLETKDLDEDELSEKANSIRRIFEFVLKIECCFHRELNYDVIFGDELDRDDFKFKDDYSDIVLGDLVKILKKIKNEEEMTTLNKIIRLSNELSHDSGKKVTKEKVIDLLKTTVQYTAALTHLV